MPYPSLSSYGAFDSPDTVVFRSSYSSTYITFEWPAIRKQPNDNAWISSCIPHLGLIASPIGASAIWCSTGTQRPGAVSDPQNSPKRECNQDTSSEAPARVSLCGSIGLESILLGLDGNSTADLQADVEVAILFKIQDQPKRGSLPDRNFQVSEPPEGCPEHSDRNCLRQS